MKRTCKQCGFFTLGLGLALFGIFSGISAGMHMAIESDDKSVAAGPGVEAVATYAGKEEK